MSAPYTELEKPLGEYAMVCRGCLAESGEMKNIFEWGLAEDYISCTSVQLQQTDSLSELICATCEETLGHWKRFRLQCQNADLLMKSASKKTVQPNSSPTVPRIEKNSVTSEICHDKIIYTIVAPNMTDKIFLTCPYCPENYIKQKDMIHHMIKIHRVEDRLCNIELQYYCSVPDCSYYVNSGNNKFFHGRKYLNQHYTKVHMERTLECNKCHSTFINEIQYERHLKNCNTTYLCELCNSTYKTNDRLLVHLMRKHPDLHKQYKEERKLKEGLKRKSATITECKKFKINETERLESQFICDSPKRSFATQTRPEDNIKNDVTLPSWQRNENFEIKTDEISTQTMFEDVLSLKSQASEEDSLFFSENVSLSDIQTQTFPLEFGLSRSHKETLTDGITELPDLSIKETQTCFCLYDSPKLNFKLFDSVSSSPTSINLTSAETQTSDVRSSVKSDVLLSFNSIETQTSFDEGKTFS